jgi:hypothetical protein
VSRHANHIDQLNQIEQLLREIDAVYEQPFYELKVPQEAQEAYQTAFRSIADAWKQFLSKLNAIYVTASNRRFSDDPKELIAPLQVHKAWIVFLKKIKGEVDTRLHYDAPNSASIYEAEYLLNQIEEELYSMQPREAEDDPDPDRAPLSDEQDRDVLHMPPLASSAPHSSTNTEVRE